MQSEANHIARNTPRCRAGTHCKSINVSIGLNGIPSKYFIPTGKDHDRIVTGIMWPRVTRARSTSLALAAGSANSRITKKCASDCLRLYFDCDLLINLRFDHHQLLFYLRSDMYCVADFQRGHVLDILGNCRKRVHGQVSRTADPGRRGGQWWVFVGGVAEQTNIFAFVLTGSRP